MIPRPEAREARAEFEKVLDFPFSPRASFWLDALVVLSEATTS
jgi:hypothetical protein